MTTDPKGALHDPIRLAAVREVEACADAPEELASDITRIARRGLQAPAATLNLLDGARQVSLYCAGIAADSLNVPVEESYCQHVVMSGGVVAITDTRADARTDRMASERAPWIAYLGAPVRGRMGQVVGALCVLDTEPHEWSEADVALIADLANVASRQLVSRVEHRVSGQRQQVAALETLRKSEERFRTMFENAVVGMVMADSDGRVIAWNPALRRMLGYGDKPPELITDLVHDDDRADALRDIGRLYAHQIERYTAERNFICADGSLRRARVAVSLVPDPSGAEPRLLSFVQDVTEERRLEEEYRRHEKRFRSMIENATDFVTILSSNLRIVYGSPSIERSLGHAMKDLIGHSPLDFIHPDDRRAALGLLSSCDDEADPTGQLLYRFRRADGSWRWIESNGRNLLDDPDVQGIVINSRDVTEQRAVQERLAHVLSNSPSVLWLLRLHEGSVADIWVSDNIADVLGIAPGSATLAWYNTALHADDRDSVNALLESVLAGQRDEVSSDHRLRHADGEYRWVRAQMRTLRDETGRVVELVGSWIDTTEMRSLEEQLRQSVKMEAVGLLAGGVAHDFNNLLTAIIGNAELALSDLPVSNPVRNDIVEIREAAARAGSLTKQLLAFSRKQVMHPEVLDLGIVISDMERMLRRVLTENIRMVTRTPAGLGFVLADRTQIEQVLLNLVVNARDAMRSGGGLTVELRTEHLERPVAREQAEVPAGDYVVLTVSDTGAGIPAAVLPRIFEPFFTTKANGEGTGLGLSTVFGIVKQSGGYVWVSSALDAGTTFEIQFPAVAPSGSSRLPPSEPDSDLPRGTGTVLVVEDDDAVRELAVRVLRNLGYSVLEAQNGRMALPIAWSQMTPIDLLVTDVIMPQMGGVELADEMVAMHPEIRVLYMSGYSEEAIERNGVLRRGSSLLEKPFTRMTLGRAVHTAMNGGRRSVATRYYEA